MYKDVKEEGYLAFTDGKDWNDNPYPVNSDDYNDWHLGYSDAALDYHYSSYPEVY